MFAVEAYDLIEIGNNAVLDSDASIKAFVENDEGTHVTFSRIKIGAGVLVGAKASVAAGSYIGSHTKIAPMAQVEGFVNRLGDER